MQKRASIRRLVLVLGVFTIIGARSVAQSANELGLAEIVDRMADAQIAAHNNPGYRAVREYRLSAADESVPTSEVIAEVDYLPPSSKQFTIRQAQGSDRGEKIVRRVLEHESQMASRSAQSEFTPDNYQFALLGQETVQQKRCYVLQLTPKRSSTDLINGKAWVDAESFLLRRVQGQPAKNPSWWIKNVDLTIEYGSAAGIWLPVATQAHAELRLLGRHTLTSRDVQVQTAVENAALAPPAARSNRRTPPRKSAASPAAWLSR
jgi:hypothetical protein